MKPTNNRIYCIGCRHTKMLFESEQKATNFIKFNREEIALSSKKVPLRAYYCSFCCGWHVTSVSDKERIDILEARDKHKWEGIKFAINKGNQETQEASKFLSFEEAVEEYKYFNMLKDTLTRNLQYAESDLRNMELEEAVRHSRLAQKYFGDANAYAHNNNLLFSRKHDLEKMTIALVESFEIIRMHDADHESRQTYLCLTPAKVNPYAKIFLRNKDFIEVTDTKLTELETLVKYGVNVSSLGMMEEIERDIRDFSCECIGKKVGKKRKQFQSRLGVVKSKAGIYNETDSIEDEIKIKYLTVIDILEKAHLAYAKRDNKGFRIMMKVAERLLPEEKNEIRDALFANIQKMKKEF
ncbi:MAG: hypothetical protein K2K75_06175 [Muribaculaceae bacterium]|nr:hypothetical protein [Muribaculaceae bacterium]